MTKARLKQGMTFHDLVLSIKDIHQQCIVQAAKAVNVSLTLRNWMIGYYIEEYERAGIDRANYGERIMDVLSNVGKSGVIASTINQFR